MGTLVTSFEPWPGMGQTLRVYRNTLPDAGNWIGFRLGERLKSPVGVQVKHRWAGHTAVRQIATGDSHRSQHANLVHFGLGKANQVESAEIRWPGGEAVTLRTPAVNRYHKVEAPGNGAGDASRAEDARRFQNR
jgi:hypothetical protein